MESEWPASPIDFINNANQAKDVDLYSFTDLQFEMILRIPGGLHGADLVDFVRLALSLADESTVHLFASAQKADYPDTTPLDPAALVPADMARYFYSVTYHTASDVGCRTLVVEFSEDGYRLSNRRCVFMKPPIVVSAVKKLMNDLIKDRPVRILKLSDHEIQAELRPSDSISAAGEVLRFDVLARQPSARQTETVAKIIHVRVDRIGYYKVWGFPFLLPIGTEDTVQAVRSRVQSVLGLSVSASSWDCLYPPRRGIHL
jgi:hypothetical protein